MLTLYVCSKTASLTSKETVKLDLTQQDDSSANTSEINNKLTVENLMIAIKEKLSLTGSIDDYQLVCYGKKLKGDKLLSQYGIKSNAVVHLFLKSAEERSANKKINDCNPKGKGKKAKSDQTQDIHAMVMASRTALMNQSFRQMLTRLHENDFRNNLIQCTPGLKDDPIAIAVLHDAELLSMMMESSNVENVLDKHPVIFEAATHLATAFHEENATTSGRSVPTPMAVDSSPFISYSLDDLSEDDDMSGGVDAPPPNGQHVMSPTTASAFAHLMQQALLASHNSQRGAGGGGGPGGGLGGSQQSQGSLPSPSLMSLPPNHTIQERQQFQLQQLQQIHAHHQHQQQLQQQLLQQQQQQQQQPSQQQQQPTRQADNAVIAFEMLRHALQLTEPSTSQQGNNSNQPSASNALSGQSSAHLPPPPPRPDMSRQIAQMRELGLTDENVCLQALMVTNGDVQAAIELIFSETLQP